MEQHLATIWANDYDLLNLDGLHYRHLAGQEVRGAVGRGDDLFFVAGCGGDDDEAKERNFVNGYLCHGDELRDC